MVVEPSGRAIRVRVWVAGLAWCLRDGGFAADWLSRQRPETGKFNAWAWVVKMFADTLGDGLKDVMPTIINSALSNSTITALRPDWWGCVHSPH